jgi:hypothetical protein
VLANHATFASARLARIGDDLPRASAGSAGARDAEEALLVPKLSAPPTGCTRNRLLALRDAAAAAGVAGVRLAHRNFHALTKNGIAQLDSQIGAQIGAALRARAPSRRASAECLAETEEVAEYLTEVLEGRWIEAARARAAESG